MRLSPVRRPDPGDYFVLGYSQFLRRFPGLETEQDAKPDRFALIRRQRVQLFHERQLHVEGGERVDDLLASAARELLLDIGEREGEQEADALDAPVAAQSPGLAARRAFLIGIYSATEDTGEAQQANHAPTR